MKVSKTFAGFTSRCWIFLAWACSSASAILRMSQATPSTYRPRIGNESHPGPEGSSGPTAVAVPVEVEVAGSRSASQIARADRGFEPGETLRITTSRVTPGQ